MDLSFIIPAFNEADNIEHVISSIHQFVPPDYQYEIIIVDHGSSDNTVNLAQKTGATVLLHPIGTIAGLRNYGVKNSSGSVLVFLDADIRLTKQWNRHISNIIAKLQSDVRLLTGSWSSISDSPSWIESHWFKPLEHGSNSHINSGHLIISRKIFDEINGFDETLETGEDYDISIRAKDKGVKMDDNSSLRVIHEGYPKTLISFFKREFWHGKGDTTTFGTLLKSKVALASLFFLFMHGVLISSLLCGSIPWTLLSAAIITGLTLSMSLLKYRSESLLTILTNSYIYYIYFWARVLSVMSLPSMRSINKRTR